MGLGWTSREADAAVQAVADDPDTPADADVPARLRAALRGLGPR